MSFITGSAARRSATSRSGFTSRSGPADRRVHHQLQAIEKKLASNEFAVEIRIGKTTHLGDPTHHAATTLPALEAKIGKKIDIRKIGEGDRGEPNVP